MKIEMVSANREKGGVSKYTRDLVNALKEKELDVSFNEIENPKSSNPAYWLGLNQNNSDVIHYQFEYGLFGNIRQRFGGIFSSIVYLTASSPIVTTFHTVRDKKEISGSWKTKLERITGRMLDKLLYKCSDQIIVHSESSKDDLLEKGVKNEKVSVIPIGVAEGERVDKQKAKAELDLEEEKVILLFGFIRRSKAYERVIEAAEDLDYKILIAGGAENSNQKEYKQELEELVEEKNMSDRVRFTGFVDQDRIPVVMSAADLMIFPYEEITGSAVFSQGVSYGVPMAASDLKYFKEKEEKGLLTIFSDTHELKKILEKENFEEISQNLEKYRSEAVWPEVARRTRRVYQKVYSESKS